MYSLTKAFGQSDTLSECEKKYAIWKVEIERPIDFIGSGPIPQPIKTDAQNYPDSARQAQKEGTVWVWCIVDTSGIPQCVRVHKGAGFGMDEAAIEALKKWRFTPATSGGGRKWEQPTCIPFKFKLQQVE